MPTYLPNPKTISAHGSPPKQIVEHVGLASTGTDALSVAVMSSPAGWTEPAQAPEFNEWTIVLKGSLQVISESGILEIAAGEAVHVAAGEEVRYATSEATQYVSVCTPAFSPARVHRVADV